MISKIHTEICTLAAELEANLPLTSEKAAEILRSQGFQQADFLGEGDFNYPKNENYGRKVLYESQHLEILLMSWRPNAFSAIHDHGDIDFGAVQLLGNALHREFSLEKGLLEAVAEYRPEPGDVFAVPPDLIHQMGNVGTLPMVSIHLYGSNEPKAKIAADSRLFDTESGRILLTSGGAFFDPDPQNVAVAAAQFATALRTRRTQQTLLEKFRQGI